MGKVPSASTISSIAYLTDTGRKYLFGKDSNNQPIRFNPDGTDNFQVTQFALYDNDRNYRTAIVSPTGTIPDIAGTSEECCLKTSVDLIATDIVIFQGEIPQSFQEDFKYESKNIVVDAYNYNANQ